MSNVSFHGLWRINSTFEKIVGEPILGSDIWLTEDTLEMIETNDFDLLG